MAQMAQAEESQKANENENEVWDPDCEVYAEKIMRAMHSLRREEKRDPNIKKAHNPKEHTL